MDREEQNTLSYLSAHKFISTEESRKFLECMLHTPRWRLNFLFLQSVIFHSGLYPRFWEYRKYEAVIELCRIDFEINLNLTSDGVHVFMVGFFMLTQARWIREMEYTLLKATLHCFSLLTRHWPLWGRLLRFRKPATDFTGSTENSLLVGISSPTCNRRKICNDIY